MSVSYNVMEFVFSELKLEYVADAPYKNTTLNSIMSLSLDNSQLFS